MSNTLAQNPAMVTFSGATTVSVTFSSAMTNPSLIVAALTYEDVTATATIADDKNAGNYTQDLSVSSAAGGTGAGTSTIASKQNTQTAAITVTATVSASATGTLKAYEFTGAATSTALDAQNAGTGASTNQSVGITTNTANCSIVACSTHYPSGATPDTSFTASFTETGGLSAYHYAEHRVDAGAAGSSTLTMGLGSEQGWTMAVAAYKTSGGGAAATQQTLMLLGVGS